jgi:hypothetical protein
MVTNSAIYSFRPRLSPLQILIASRFTEEQFKKIETFDHSDDYIERGRIEV